ncbi:MAG TPA: regulatory protein RecX [Pyrinomonadaceae bacterium]|nr:regulatory protein RecX [Pyrinomonadaceae bacterium]
MTFRSGGKKRTRPRRSPNPADRQLREDAVAEKPRRAADPEKSRARTLQRAVKLLAAKPRSVAELRERLLEKEWTDEAAADYAVAKLTEYGYLDDEQFALSFAQSRVRQKPVGRQRLARDLKNKKLDKETAEQALEKVFEETPEEKLIDEAIARRVRLRGRPKTREESKSLFDHLLRRGFSIDLVINKVRALSASPLDEESDDTSADGDE